MRRRPAVAVLLVAVYLPAASAEERKSLRLAWSELGPAVEGRKVSLALAGGKRADGRVLGVEPDGVRLGGAWTTDSSIVIRRGKTLIPRSSVTVIRTRRYSKYWRLLLTAGLPAALLGATAFAASRQGFAPDPAKMVPIGVAITAGGLVGGYIIGHRLDRRELTEITIAETK